MATMATSDCTKEFFVDYGDGNKASVDVTSEHTLADVRRLMSEDWDGDMLPDQDVEWAFWVVDSNQRITEKQEGRKKAWNFIGKDVRIHEGIDKNCSKNENKNKKRPAFAASSNSAVKNENDNDNNHHDSKRQKIVSDVSTVAPTGLQSAAVSPEETVQPARANQPSSEHEHEEAASEVHGSEFSSSSSSQNLESNKPVTNHNGSSSSSSDEEMSPVALLEKLEQVAIQAQEQEQPPADDDDDSNDDGYDSDDTVRMADDPSDEEEDPEGEAPPKCTAKPAADHPKHTRLVAKDHAELENDRTVPMADDPSDEEDPECEASPKCTAKPAAAAAAAAADHPKHTRLVAKDHAELENDRTVPMADDPSDEEDPECEAPPKCTAKPAAAAAAADHPKHTRLVAKDHAELENDRTVPMADDPSDEEDPEGEASPKCAAKSAAAAAADNQKHTILVAKDCAELEEDPEDDIPVFVSMYEDDTEKGSANADDDDDDDEENAEQDEEEMQDVATPEDDENPHKEADEALDKSHTVLRRMESILKEHEYFCNQARRDEWMTELQTLFQNERPQTVIGVLGNTGVYVFLLRGALNGFLFILLRAQD
jgi:hypothetical protein